MHRTRLYRPLQTLQTFTKEVSSLILSKCIAFAFRQYFRINSKHIISVFCSYSLPKKLSPSYGVFIRGNCFWHRAFDMDDSFFLSQERFLFDKIFVCLPTCNSVYFCSAFLLKKALFLVLFKEYLLSTQVISEKNLSCKGSAIKKAFQATKQAFQSGTLLYPAILQQNLVIFLQYRSFVFHTILSLYQTCETSGIYIQYTNDKHMIYNIMKTS